LSFSSCSPKVLAVVYLTGKTVDPSKTGGKKGRKTQKGMGTLKSKSTPQKSAWTGDVEVSRKGDEKGTAKSGGQFPQSSLKELTRARKWMAY